MFSGSKHSTFLARVAVAVLTAGLLGGCGNTLKRLTEVGETPPLTEIQDPTHSPNYRPVSLPMPQATPVTPQPNSLWRPGSRAFFKDQRASQVGDILTVVIEIDDSASLNNETDRTRTTSEEDSFPSLLGFENDIQRLLPDSDPANAVDISGSTRNNGAGRITRGENIEVKVAAVITQVLPNGNLVLRGSQEVRVNYEVRELQVSGIVRREDIGNDNRISYEKIAEARVAYGGRGHISDVQQPRYGTQILDIIYPF